MNTSYDELKIITDRQYELVNQTGNISLDFHDQIIDLLAKNGLRIRKKDGSNPKVTFSIPKSRGNSFVVGVRYTKLDGTKTEDHFIFTKDLPIEPCYGKRLERIFPEYKHAHKFQR